MKAGTAFVMGLIVVLIAIGLVLTLPAFPAFAVKRHGHWHNLWHAHAYTYVPFSLAAGLIVGALFCDKSVGR